MVKSENKVPSIAAAAPEQPHRDRAETVQRARSILATMFLLLAGGLMLVAYGRAVSATFFDGRILSVTLILAIGAVVALCISLFLVARFSVSYWSDPRR